MRKPLARIVERKDLYQKATARTSIPASSLRGQKVKGMVDVSRRYLGNLDLSWFSVRSNSAFNLELDRSTNTLAQ